MPTDFVKKKIVFKQKGGDIVCVVYPVNFPITMIVFVMPNTVHIFTGDFLSTEERIARLTEYKDDLSREIKEIEDRIASLKNE